MKLQMYLPTGFVWNNIISLLFCWKRLNYFPRFFAPRTFNEYFLREKIYFSGDISLAKTLTDKIGFKEWLLENGFSDLIIQNLLVAESTKELEEFKILTPCIIKPTHSSGHVLLIKEPKKQPLTIKELALLNNYLKEDYYIRGREPNYSGLKPRLIVEELLLDSEGNPPFDYKIFCVNGSPFLIQVDLDRFAEHTRQLYTINWEILPYSMYYARNPRPLSRPEQLDYALHISARLSKDFFLCRVDLYFVGNRTIKAGEVTFFPGNCAEKFEPVFGDFELGKMISNSIWK